MESTSSIVSTLGGGSGIDMAKLARDLAQARFAAQKEQLEKRGELMQTRISAASGLRNQLTQLALALGERVRSGDLAPSASVSPPGIAKVTLAPGRTPRGEFALSVTQLAAGQTLAARSYSSPDSAVGEGTLTMRFGTVDGGTFVADTARAAINIEVGAGDTLTGIADKINAAGSSVSAYVASTATGAQLVLKGAEGAGNAFTLEGTGASAAGAGAGPGAIDYLNWHPASGGGTLTQSARDAIFSLDGLAMSSASNRVTGLADGMAMTLTGTGAGAQIGIAPRDGEVTGLMRDLVSALNEIGQALRTSADPLAGELGNDPGARALRRSLSELVGSVIMPNAAPGEPRTFGDLGLAIERNGTFRLDEARLGRTLSETPQAAATMFTPGLFGVFASVDKLARSLNTLGNPGSLGGSIARYGKAQADINERLSGIAEKQEALRAQLSRNFTWADRDIASSQTTLNFLKNQIAIWNAPRN